MQFFKRLKPVWVIHIFALLHAGVALCCRLAGVEDELLLTILTMTMVLLICMKRSLNIELTAANIIIANILVEPDLYGSLSLLLVIITILQVFVDSGLGNALVQKKDADNLDFSTVFYFNIVFCAVLYVGLFLRM